MFDIGNRIRQLRIKNDLTLQELASRTELTKGFLSQLERNLTSPSLQTLEDIAEALGVTMSEFFNNEKEEKIVFTAEDAFIAEEGDRIIRWIVPNAQKNAMEPIILELSPQGESEMIRPHDGEEFGYVLEGSVKLVRRTAEKEYTVNKGEVFYLKADETHYLKNDSEQKCFVLWISTPPAF